MNFNRKTYLALTISLIIIAFSCEKDSLLLREYPQLRTLEVSNVDESGATLNAEIISGDWDEIIAYGFVWAPENDPAWSSDEKRIISKKLSSNKFSTIITAALEPELKYSVRAFVETDTFTVFGNRVKFVSLGSLSPVIDSFFPESGEWGDTITVIGKNFSTLTDLNIGYLGAIKLNCTSASDTLLRYVIPEVANKASVELAVEVFEKTAVANASFSYKLPVIKGLSNEEAAFGDTLTIFLENELKRMKVSFDGQEAKIVQVTKTAVSVIVSNAINRPKPTVSVRVSGYVDKYVSFNVKQPIVDSTYSFSVHYGDTISIKGSFFNTDPQYNRIGFSTVTKKSFFATSNLLKFLVSDDITLMNSKPTLKSGPFSNQLGTFNINTP
jgi:hypothetical protein